MACQCRVRYPSPVTMTHRERSPLTAYENRSKQLLRVRDSGQPIFQIHAVWLCSCTVEIFPLYFHRRALECLASGSRSNWTYMRSTVTFNLPASITAVRVTRPPSTHYFLVAIARAVHAMFYVQWLLYGNESRRIMYTFIYSICTRTGMKMSWFIITEHPRTLHYWISPIFIPTSNHIFPGHRRGRRRPHSVGWS